VIALTAFISPFRADRERVRNTVRAGDFLEIYCRCSAEECERRDVKGLYRKARANLIPDFTGVSSPYEEPQNPDLTLDTSVLDLEECVVQVLRLLGARDVVQPCNAIPA